MPSSERIKGTDLLLTLGGVEYKCDATSVVLESEEADSDVTTFCDAAEGGSYDYRFTISAVSSTASGSFWTYLFDNPGEKEVAYVYAPHGNETPSVAKPHFEGTLSLPGGMPSIGGEAGETSTFEVELLCDGRPTKVTA